MNLCVYWKYLSISLYLTARCVYRSFSSIFYLQPFYHIGGALAFFLYIWGVSAHAVTKLRLLVELHDFQRTRSNYQREKRDALLENKILKGLKVRQAGYDAGIRVLKYWNGQQKWFFDTFACIYLPCQPFLPQSLERLFFFCAPFSCCIHHSSAPCPWSTHNSFPLFIDWFGKNLSRWLRPDRNGGWTLFEMD